MHYEGPAMKIKPVSYFCYALLFVAACTAQASNDELTLDQAGDLFGYYGGFNYGYGGYGAAHNQGLGARYGMGGYGDAATANNSLKVCTASDLSRNCYADNPDAGELEWRFIKNLGWRKFTKYGAARKDWWDYKKTLGWPFHSTYGTLLK